MIHDIIEKLEKAEGSSRELDARTHAALFPETSYMSFSGDVCLGLPAEYERLGDFDFDKWGDDAQSVDWDALAHIFGASLPYTSSIDAAVFLAERVLPGWIVDHIGQDYAGDVPTLQGFGWCVELTDGERRSQGQSKSFAIAWLLATLRALQQKGSSNG